VTLKWLETGLSAYPALLRGFIGDAKLRDRSCSPEARVAFIDKDGGYFLKSASKGSLRREAAMTRYFHGKGLAAKVVAYISSERDWLLTENLRGSDCTAPRYLEQPEKLCDTLAERLSLLHSLDFALCPVPNHTESYLAKAARNYQAGLYDLTLFSDNWGYASAEEAYGAIKKSGGLLQADTLLHGDYCLPNVILDDWGFSGFVDLDSGGVGDRHVDLFWAAWTLGFNLKTDRYRARLIDAYGRGKVDEEMFRVIAAVEIFSGGAPGIIQ
jgi:kanamycin kinase